MLRLILAAALWATASVASAAPLVFLYEGQERRGGGVISGLVSYDPTAPDDTGPNGFGTYTLGVRFTGSIAGGAFDGGAFDIDPATVQVADATPGGARDDQILWFDPNAPTGQRTQLLLRGPDDLFDSAALPATLALGDFTELSLVRVREDVLGTERTTFDLTKLSVVPLPAAAPLLGGALLSLLGLARRR